MTEIKIIISWVLIVYMVVLIGYNLGKIGEPKEPTTASDIWFQIAWASLMAFALLY